MRRMSAGPAMAQHPTGTTAQLAFGSLDFAGTHGPAKSSLLGRTAQLEQAWWAVYPFMGLGGNFR